MLSLPSEIIEHVCFFLTWRETIQLSMTSWWLSEIIKSCDYLWRHHLDNLNKHELVTTKIWIDSSKEYQTKIVYRLILYQSLLTNLKCKPRDIFLSLSKISFARNMNTLPAFPFVYDSDGMIEIHSSMEEKMEIITDPILFYQKSIDKEELGAHLILLLNDKIEAISMPYSRLERHQGCIVINSHEKPIFPNRNTDVYLFRCLCGNYSVFTSSLCKIYLILLPEEIEAHHFTKAIMTNIKSSYFPEGRLIFVRGSNRQLIKTSDPWIQLMPYAMKCKSTCKHETNQSRLFYADLGAFHNAISDTIKEQNFLAVEKMNAFTRHSLALARTAENYGHATASEKISNLIDYTTILLTEAQHKVDKEIRLVSNEITQELSRANFIIKPEDSSLPMSFVDYVDELIALEKMKSPLSGFFNRPAEKPLKRKKKRSKRDGKRLKCV